MICALWTSLTSSLLCREDLDDDLAYLITWCMIRTRQALEAQYAMLPQERSPLVIPIDPVEMANTPIPLHPAAERAYRDVGAVGECTHRRCGASRNRHRHCAARSNP